MSSDRKHVRIRPETLAQLHQLRRELIESYSLTGRKPFWTGEDLTFCDLLAELVRRELSHRERSRASAARRVRSGSDAGQEVPAAS